MRLVMTAGIAAAGFCLVLAMVVAVAALGARASRAASPRSMPGRTATGALGRAPAGDRETGPAVPGAGPGHQPTKRDGRTGAPARARIIEKYRGSGSGSRGPFSIGESGIWGASWSYTCRATGWFMIAERHLRFSNDVEINISGRRGHGLLWEDGDLGHHSLIVTSDSDCRWSVNVLVPASPRQ